MYEQVITCIAAIAPSLATVITAIMMFIRIVSSTREMCAKLRDDSTQKIDDAMRSMYAQVSVLQQEVKKITESNEIRTIKEQNKRLLEELEESKRMNAELLAKLNYRG